MTLRSQLALATLSILATAALAATAADARPGQGHGQHPQSDAPSVESVPEVETPAVEVETPDLTVGTPGLSTDTLTPGQQPTTGSAQENHPDHGTNFQNLPPGLQRRVESGRGLPPGLQRQAESDRGLPPGLQNR